MQPHRSIIELLWARIIGKTTVLSPAHFRITIEAQRIGRKTPAGSAATFNYSVSKLEFDFDPGRLMGIIA